MGDLGRAIRELRGERDVSIEVLAFAAGIHPTYVSSIERGLRNPSWIVLCALAGALQIPVAELARRVESAERVREGVERVLEDERARLAGHPSDRFRMPQLEAVSPTPLKLLAHGDQGHGMGDVIVSRDAPGSGRDGGPVQHSVFGLIEPLCLPNRGPGWWWSVIDHPPLSFAIRWWWSMT
jgi:transcriptional regulator with XRE-family HTH domain